MKNNNTQKNNPFNSRTIDRIGRKALEDKLPSTKIYISDLEKGGSRKDKLPSTKIYISDLEKGGSLPKTPNKQK